MKRNLLILILIMIVISADSLFSQPKPIIGVLNFTNNVTGMWWSSSSAAEIKESLKSELVQKWSFASDGIENLNFSENTGMHQSDTKGVKYLISGSFSAFEQTTATGKGGRLKKRNTSAENKTSNIALNIKIIDAETGEIADARTIETNATGKVINEAITEAAEYINCFITEGKNSPSLDKWEKLDPVQGRNVIPDVHGGRSSSRRR